MHDLLGTIFYINVICHIKTRDTREISQKHKHQHQYY